MNHATASDVPVLGQHSADPYPTYERLRAAGPVVRNDRYEGWDVVGYQAARQALRDDSFLAYTGIRQMVARLTKGTGFDFSPLCRLHDRVTFFMNPPAHAPARRVLGRVLARQPAEKLKLVAETAVDNELRRAKQDGGFDLVRDYARKIPAHIMTEILGLPEADVPTLAHNSEIFIELFDVMVPVRDYRRINDAARVLIDYFATLIRKRRAASGEDAISYAIQLIDNQRNISDDDLAGYCAFMFFAGQETTASFLAGGAAILFQNPAALAKLREDPAKLPAAADDLVRYHSPVQAVGRVASADTLLDGVKISTGDRLMIFLGAANRDPSVYPSAPCPVLRGAAAPHLAFGDGRHLCIGADLARNEGVAAFAGLLALPRITFDIEGAQWTKRRNFRALAKLPILL